MADAAMARPDLGSGEEPDDLEALVARLARIGSSHGGSLAPDSTRLAYVGNQTGAPQVWTIPTDGGAPTQVTELEEQVGVVHWAPAGDWLAFSTAPGGGMNEQIYRIRPDGSGLQRLTDGGSATNTLAGWSPDGTTLRISSNRRSSATLDPYLLDPTTGTWRLLRAATGRSAVQALSRDGRWAVESRLLSRGDNDLCLLDLREGGERLLTPHSGPGTFVNARFAPDSRTIYLIANGDRDLLALGALALDEAGGIGPLTILAARDDAELDEFAISADGATIATLWNIAGRSELAFFDTASETIEEGPALPGAVASGLSLTGDGERLLLGISGARAPHDLWLIERRGGALRQLTHSAHDGIDLDTLVAPTLARFAAHDGLELSGWLYRPHGATVPGPLVLDFHGGPEGQARPLFNATYQALLARGIGIFAPNVRGSSGFGKRFVNLDNGALRHDAVRDIRSCAEFVVATGAADPQRLGIMGGSYGGYMTMAGLADYPERFAAGANLYGVVNFATFFAHTEPWMAAISKVEYGDPDTEAELLRDLSPIHRVDRVTAPTIVLHGANDTNVPVVEAEQVVARLRERGVPVEYILFADEGHGFRTTANRIFAAAAITRWFSTYL